MKCIKGFVYQIRVNIGSIKFTTEGSDYNISGGVVIGR